MALVLIGSDLITSAALMQGLIVLLVAIQVPFGALVVLANQHQES